MKKYLLTNLIKVQNQLKHSPYSLKLKLHKTKKPLKSRKIGIFKDFIYYFLTSFTTHSTCIDLSGLIFHTFSTVLLHFPSLSVIGNKSLATFGVSVSGNKSSSPSKEFKPTINEQEYHNMCLLMSHLYRFHIARNT